MMMPIVCRFSRLTHRFDNTEVFTELSATLSNQLTGLLGRNGQGKSVLMALLAQAMPASSGSISWSQPFHWVQQTERLQGPRIAEALGVSARYDCFQRIESGTANEEDFALVTDLWHLPAQWERVLQEAGLDMPLSAPVNRLSGGEQTRVALCRAFLLHNHYLLLDEPSNHLDTDGRIWLAAKLSAHPAGALVITHDRDLLHRVDHILELDAHGLHEYGGNYAVYRSIRDAQVAATEQQVSNLKKEQRKQTRAQQQEREKAAQRRKQGEQLRRSGSQSKLLLNAKKGSAESNLGKLKQRQQQRSNALSNQLSTTQETLETIKPQSFHTATSTRRQSLCLYISDLVLPYVTAPPLSMTVHSGERWHIQGSNGSGKSTLLRIIAGLEQAKTGNCQVHGQCIYLDQHFSLLDDEQSALQNLQHLHPDSDESILRTELAGLRLRADKALQPVKQLSGGERLKVALLAVMHGETAPDLLLLDEPDNHLDLESRLLLEQVLAGYPGTLIIVSHDLTLVAGIGHAQTTIQTFNVSTGVIG
ncbi:MAG: ATP-binding cassette domain-containing protein [Thiolinea sp.]